jgi:hypothetical protein
MRHDFISYSCVAVVLFGVEYLAKVLEMELLVVMMYKSKYKQSLQRLINQKDEVHLKRTISYSTIT